MSDDYPESTTSSIFATLGTVMAIFSLFVVAIFLAKNAPLLIQKVWEHLPPEFKINRLVLTAPVETYRAYKSWLANICSSFVVDEIAIVDEPTAAAMGAGVPAGSKLLVIDIGGSTIDLSLVRLEGGEGGGLALDGALAAYLAESVDDDPAH